MTIHDSFAGAQFVTEITDMALAKGITLHIGTDFTQYARIIAQYRKGQPLGAPFDPTKQNVHQNNGFWITGWNDAGQLVHTQAMRRFALKNTLSEYLEERFRDFPPAGVDPDLKTSRYVPGPGARRIRGITCYHGEAWLMGGENGYRGTGIAGALARFALASCMLRWSPDHVFGFMPETHAFRGLVEREGYMHTDPGAVFWHPTGQAGVLRGHMVWMAREDLAHMMAMPLRTLVA